MTQPYKELVGKTINDIEIDKWQASNKGYEQMIIGFTDGSSLCLRGFFRLEVEPTPDMSPNEYDIG